MSSFPISSLRKDFPILSSKMNGKPLAFLDSAASSQRPKQVIETISKYYQEQHSNVHRGVYKLSQEATDLFETARRKTAQFLGAQSANEIIWTTGCTQSINIIAQCLTNTISAGDEIVISTMEHHSNIVPWQELCKRTGAHLKVISITDEGEIDLTHFKKCLSPKTKVLSIVHVSNALGTINPVKEMTKLAKEAGAYVVIDGAQSTPHQKIDVTEIGCDFFAFSAHKMCGPTGVGVLFGREELLNELPPYQFGGEMIKEVTFESTTYNVLPFKFEAGTPNIAGAIGLGSAIDYLTAIGLDKIELYENELLKYLTDEMSNLSGITLIGKAQKKHSVYSFTAQGTHPFDLGTLLDKQGIAVRTGHHCCQPLMKRFNIPGTVRASVAFYNTFEDIDRLVLATDKALKMLR